MQHNRLRGTRSYVAGPMDLAPDGGIGWREDITPFLEDMGVVVLNPCNKPIDIGHENTEDRIERHKYKQEGSYDKFSKIMKELRCVDLRMVDMADFLIVYLNLDIPSCGTYEELFWANRLKNPVLVMCEQKKQNAPDWIFGCISHQHIFSTWDELREYLRHINEDEHILHMKRWLFFDYKRMIPKKLCDWKGGL